MINQRLALSIALLALGSILSAQVRNNDDSCDITVAPAATLLLPFFEVDLTAAAGAGQTTVFTVTNVTAAPQIAHVTIWTDWAYPLLTFNLFLTGYDMQTINLYDVLVRDVVAPAGPGTSSTNFLVSPHAPQGSVGAFSAPLSNLSNPNILPEAVIEGGSCSGVKLPGILPVDLMNAVRTALTTGLYNPVSAPSTGCGNRRIGSSHTTARGYMTIDVVNTCSTRLPDDLEYIVRDLLFDNALIGDYEQLDADTTVGNFAAGNPMVHLRAIPEGGPAGSSVTNLPYTFYERTMVRSPQWFSRTFDRRQPLPTVFAARWIEAGASGFQTHLTIWREGMTFGTESCSTVAANSAMPIAEIIRFDEREIRLVTWECVQVSVRLRPHFPRHLAFRHRIRVSFRQTDRRGISPAGSFLISIPARHAPIPRHVQARTGLPSRCSPAAGIQSNSTPRTSATAVRRDESRGAGSLPPQTQTHDPPADAGFIPTPAPP